MSFGGSVGDILVVLDFAKELYRKCKAAGGEYVEVSREVGSLHTVLRHLKYEVEAPESLLNRDKSKYGAQLRPIIGNCDHILQQLDDLLRKYGKLAEEKPPIWDRIRFASAEMDSLNDIRMKLNNHKTTITVFLDTVQLHHGAVVSKTLDGHGGQLDVILDKVDKIAQRMGNRAGSMWTSYGSDDKEVWKEFRRELIAEGFSSDVLQRNKDILRAYIREVDQKGLLTEAPLTPVSASSVTPEWLESVPPGQVPAGVETENIPSNEGMKEVVIHEENLKFPQSIKTERGRPDLRSASQDIQHGISALVIDTNKGDGDYRVKPSIADRDDSSSDELYASSNNGCQVVVMRTSDLSNPSNFSGADNNLLRAPEPRRPASSQPDYYSRSNSPASIISHASNGSRSMSVASGEQRPTDTSELRDYLSHSSGRRSEHSRSPRPSSFTLAPDSMGNQIPSHAKWTKIKRSLVCLETLDQDRHRYEARPDYVAVLGVLSHQEIEDLALRSKAIRDARRRPSREAPNQPVPRKAPQNFRYSRSKKGGYNTSSDEDFSSEPERLQRPRPKDRRKRSSRRNNNEEQPYADAPLTPDWSPNLQPAPQAVWPPTSPPPGWQSPVQQMHGYPYSYNPNATGHGPTAFLQPNYYPPPQPYLSPNPPLDNRSHRSRRHGGSVTHQSQGRDVNRSGRSSRWREQLTAAGVGGAAVSLLSVLSEAAGEL